MSKLATPVQYEPSLDGLNEVRPLTLADEAKTGLNIPAFIATEFNLEGQSHSKLLRCNQVGAALKNGNAFAENTEYKIFHLYDGHLLDSATFSQRVNGVIARYYGVRTPDEFFWCDESGDIDFVEIDKDVWKYLPFVGKTIYCRAYRFGTFFSYVQLYGFY